MPQEAGRTEPQAIQDAADFTRFAEAIGPQALGVALRWTHHQELAEDVVQEAFVRAWRSRFQVYHNPRTWFYRILWNVFLNQTQSRRETAAPDIGAVVDPGTDQERQAVDDRDEIARLLSTLPAIDQHLLAMRYGENWTVAEMADTTGIPVGTIKSRIHRALKQLRRRIR